MMTLTIIFAICSSCVFADSIYDLRENDKVEMLRNNPFTYSYEYEPLVLTTTQHFNQAEAHDGAKLIDAIAYGLAFSKYGVPIAAAIGIYNFFDGSHGQPGTLKIWSGEKRQIATSTLTGKSHVSNIWVQYRIMFTGDDGSVLVDYSGNLHVR